MGDTAVQCCLSPYHHDFLTQFPAEYVSKTHNLTWILQHLISQMIFFIVTYEYPVLQRGLCHINLILWLKQTNLNVLLFTCQKCSKNMHVWNLMFPVTSVHKKYV